ncbi:vWA domain-containing protein [Haloplanus litoreus]
MGGSKLDNAKAGAKTLVDTVGDDVNVGLVQFSSGAGAVSDLTTSKSQTKSDIDSLSAGGTTNVGAGIDAGQNLLTDDTRGARSGVNKVLVVLGNGQSSTGRSEATAAKDAGTTIYTIAYGTGADENLMEDISSPPKIDDGSITDDDQFAFISGETDISGVFSGIGGRITSGEEVFFQGSLREALTALEDPDGQGVPLEGNVPAGQAGGTGRDCFDGQGAVHYVGFAWWLPVDHGNEVQSDSATFDLGFYTEQCRHNDGGGMNSEQVDGGA